MNEGWITETICCGFHWTDPPIDKDVAPFGINTVEVPRTINPRRDGWELVLNTEYRFRYDLLEISRVWLCPDCIARLRGAH